MKRSAVMLCAALALLPLTAAAQPQRAPSDPTLELNLAVGENQTLPAADVKSYSEGAPGVADIKLTPNGTQFVIAGQKPGSTTLLLLKRDNTETTYNINVFARPLRTVAAELNDLLGDQTGIMVKKIGARFFIEGGVSAEADLVRIQHIASLYEGQVVSLVVLGGAAAVRKINIRVDFYFVQYDKSKGRRLGVDWPARVGGEGNFASFAYDFASTVATGTLVAGTPLPGLDLAANSGWAKVLKHATVITGNGTEATFSSGGVQNFTVGTAFTSSIQAVRFGTEVQVLPRFDPSSREMTVSITADVADLTPPEGATNIPGQNLSKLTTNVALKLGQSVVLSGIKTANEEHNTSGLPWLSEIPVLGLLFGSQSVRRHEVEGALFIVPSVLDTASARATDLIDKALSEYGEYDGDLREVEPFEERPRGPAPRPAFTR